MSPTLVNYISQVSTWTGLIKLACALGLFTATPDIQNELSSDAVQLITGILALVGAIDVLRNEKKQAMIQPNTTQPKG